MAVLERSELQASPLADLHAIADQLGLDGFRRLRKPELIDAILAEAGSADGSPGEAGSRSLPESAEDGERSLARRQRPRARGASGARLRRSRGDVRGGAEDDQSGAEERERDSAQSAGRDGGPSSSVAEGVVELLDNGSAFLRVSPPDPDDRDVYISAAQVRRCELVSGDRVSGPVRTPRRSERYLSLVRIDRINDKPAESVSGGVHYEDQPVDYPNQRLVLGSSDPTLEAIEWLTPLGLGSRAVIVGAPRSGKTETMRGLLQACSAREDLQVTLVLAGARPEEIAFWQEGPLAPAAALSFAASADSQGAAVERALDAAKRAAVRGADALVLYDGLYGLHLAASRLA